MCGQDNYSHVAQGTQKIGHPWLIPSWSPPCIPGGHGFNVSCWNASCLSLNFDKTSVLIFYCSCNMFPQIYLHFGRSPLSLVGKPRCPHLEEIRRLIPSRGSREKSIICLFQILESTYLPWLVVPSSIFKASNIASSLLSDLWFHCHISFDFDLLDSLFGDHFILFGEPIQIIQDNLLIWRSLI